LLFTNVKIHYFIGKRLKKIGGNIMLKKSVMVVIATAVVLSSGCSYNKANKKLMLSSAPQKVVHMSINYNASRAPIKNMSTATQDIYTSAGALNWNNAAKINSMLKTSPNQTSYTKASTNINNIKYLCREISLNNGSGNIAATQKNTASLIKYWDAVKQSVSSVYTSDCAKTQAIVNSLNRCVSTNNLSKTKSLCIDLVNQLTVIQNDISNHKV
jgi:hypothetical protein